MRANAKYISPGQMIILFGAAGALYAGICGIYDELPQMLTNAVLSAIITAAAAIPLCIFSAKEPDTDLGEGVAERSVALRIISGILLVVYFLSGAAHILGKFGEFANERIFPEGNIYICITLVGLVCIYAAHTGAQAISRMTTLIFALFILGLIMLLIGGRGDFSLSQASLAPKAISFGDVLGNGEMTGILPIFAAGAITASMLCKNAGKGLRCGLYGGLAAMLAVSTGIITIVWALLGDFTPMTEYPALDAAVYCGRRFTFSFHGLFYALWIIAAAALLSMLMACAGQALVWIFPKIRYSGAIAAAAALAIALIEALTASVAGRIFNNPVFAAVLLVVLPLIGLKKTAARAVKVGSVKYSLKRR
ncbi:MAG: hypothetical protein K2N72_04110 [Oscillospiraceae bacterium]|nr:hypothetical protein [Oscillospiraceae bacterium]